MSSAKLRRVRNGIFKDGRPIDAALWNVYFEEASVCEVLKILKAYQAQDGSFKGLYDNASNDEAIRILASVGFPKEAESLTRNLREFLKTKRYLSNLEKAFLGREAGSYENYLLGRAFSEARLIELFQGGELSHALIGLGDVWKLKKRYMELLEAEADRLEESCSCDGNWKGNIYKARRAVLNMLFITKVRSDCQ